ncbi:III, C31 subunit of DNA-directed RNA polymerase [Aspergillus heteromorphus CBS 117.55]|uniref:DNA-directed RNA polymerase III subunit n=1 Tax=Aspergillus heteromorphus CBS 117.55 TaxID=1448321 RepID=A0A317VBE7_9EURO|nr:III, C31 subunit of DNA-directed RNA polymerase [Aspergillus heteromorphus CBS 117.55]PWY70272.1 III, C31 subunit of DNA-directed RNA polymerase [Aspergillus heteromorphus CBS 117.55]
MSRFGAKKGRKLPGAEFSWETGDAGGEPDTAPTPLFPKYTVPRGRPLTAQEQLQVDLYRSLRERIHDGPYYSILDGATSAAKKDSAARANFDPFHGMQSYSGKYQKKKRALPRILGRQYVMKFFPRELWQTIQPTFRPDAAMDGYVPQVAAIAGKRGFEDDEEEEDDEAGKRRKTGGGEDEDAGDDGDDDKDVLDPDEEQEEQLEDDDFEDDDDDMGGDYNAEQYFDGGDDEYGDDGFGDGGGGGDEETY